MHFRGLLLGALVAVMPALSGAPARHEAAAARGEAGTLPPRPLVASRSSYDPWNHLEPSKLRLRSASALVMEPSSGKILYAKEPDRVTPIASLTKLMTAMVVLDAGLPMDEPITITEEDVDTLRQSLSHLPVGWSLSRRELLNLALMASENRAAAALARTYPGGLPAFLRAMNDKAAELGMEHTRFFDSSGLHAENVSTAEDLLKMVKAAYRYGTIRRMTTTDQLQVRSRISGRSRTFGNSNGLVRNRHWTIGLSKTGYITDSGFCLVMESTISGRPVIMILLDSQGKLSRIGDAARIRNWIESGSMLALGSRAGTRGHAGA